MTLRQTLRLGPLLEEDDCTIWLRKAPCNGGVIRLHRHIPEARRFVEVATYHRANGVWLTINLTSRETLLMRIRTGVHRCLDITLAIGQMHLILAALFDDELIDGFVGLLGKVVCEPKYICA